MALRDAGSNTIQEMVRYLFAEASDKSMNFARDNVLPTVRRGLIDTTDSVRNEYVAILSVMVSIRTVIWNHSKTYICIFFQVNESINVDKAPKVLKELGQLIDSDPDVDFFENMKHLQLHRKTKALTRLSKGIQSGELVFSGETLHQILLLFPSTFLFNPAYAKLNNVLDSAIQVIYCIFRRS